MSGYTEAELRRAYDEGVDMGERGFADQPDELDIGFRVLKRHIENPPHEGSRRPSRPVWACPRVWS